jgi:hypothetical protein
MTDYCQRYSYLAIPSLNWRPLEYVRRHPEIQFEKRYPFRFPQTNFFIHIRNRDSFSLSVEESILYSLYCRLSKIIVSYDISPVCRYCSAGRWMHRPLPLNFGIINAPDLRPSGRPAILVQRFSLCVEVIEDNFKDILPEAYIDYGGTYEDHQDVAVYKVGTVTLRHVCFLSRNYGERFCTWEVFSRTI